MVRPKPTRAFWSHFRPRGPGIPGPYKSGLRCRGEACLARGRRPPRVSILQFMQSTVLFRPVGQHEYDLIEAAGFRRFPPRLPEQPFFYPVTNEEYASQIARDWNTKDEASGYVGYVLRFSVRSEFLRKFQIRTVGSTMHQEYWIPAAELEQFNSELDGQIESIACFRRSY